MESSAASSSSDAGRLCVGECPTHSWPSRAPRVTLRTCADAAVRRYGGWRYGGCRRLRVLWVSAAGVLLLRVLQKDARRGGVQFAAAG